MSPYKLGRESDAPSPSETKDHRKGCQSDCNSVPGGCGSYVMTHLRL